MENSIYGNQGKILNTIMEDIVSQIKKHNKTIRKTTGHPAFEHINYRIKSEESMFKKCRKIEAPATPETALKKIKDSIGIRIVTRFTEDIYKNVAFLKTLPNCHVIKEKDYIQNPKPNGYRSYHLILEMEEPFQDILGNLPGKYFVEIQLRTIAMDCWASLEHEMKYKKEFSEQNSILVNELKRCSDELASCDITMNTIRKLLRGE